jgi:hypothetical protein
MANSNNIFTEFNSIIKLTDAKRKNLKTSRRALRNKIRGYFKDNKPDEIQPKFFGQGSMAMDTIVNPIPRTVIKDGKESTVLLYDIDDGVYFIGQEEIGQRKSIQTYHNWIVEGAKGHTDTPPIDKDTCVRVKFSDGHHIDLPIYYKKGETPELAHKQKGWVESDPRGFVEWFNSRADEQEQLRRIVRYFKAWRDYRDFTNNSKKMPSGLILSILATNNYVPRDRDDVSLKETLVNIEAALTTKFECLRPTKPIGEDLLAGYPNKEFLMEKLKSFIEDAKKALEETNKKKSCLYWQNHFGNRFPCGLAKDEDEERKETIGLRVAATPSIPWVNK